MVIDLTSPTAIQAAFNSTVFTQAVGKPIECHYLRVKPNTSVWAEISGELGGNTRGGWAYYHYDPAKMRKFHKLATRYGLPLYSTESGILLGNLALDPLLHKGWQFMSDPLSHAKWSLLKYRPARRIVLRQEDTQGARSLVRLLAEWSPATVSALTPLHQAGVGAALLEADPIHKMLKLQWLDGKTAARLPSGGLQSALEVLTRLHAVNMNMLPLPHYDAAWSYHVLEQAQITLQWLLPEQRELIRTLNQRIQQGVLASLQQTPCVVHGDFSADQIIWSEDDHGQAKLIDFDRLGYGQPAMDVGALLAVELLQGAAQLPTLAYCALRAWVAHALVQRAAEPYRYGSPTWQNEVMTRLQYAQAVLE